MNIAVICGCALIMHEVCVWGGGGGEGGCMASSLLWYCVIEYMRLYMFYLLVRSLSPFHVINAIMFIRTCDNHVQYTCHVCMMYCEYSCAHPDPPHTHAFVYSTGHTVDMLHW